MRIQWSILFVSTWPLHFATSLALPVHMTIYGIITILNKVASYTSCSCVRYNPFVSLHYNLTGWISIRTNKKLYNIIAFLSVFRLLQQHCSSSLFIMSMFRGRRSRQQQQDHEHHEQNPESKINELRSALGPLSGRSLKYCTDACLKRYLEARNWNLEKAKKMLEETLAWRSTYKPEEIRWHEIAAEGETGKVFRSNFHDRFGRTVLIMRPGLQNTTGMENQMRQLVYLIENAILNLPEGQEEMVWLIDFTGWSLSANVPVKTARETINILQNHYPQRLAVAFLYNPPRIFEAFWKIVKYFLDPKTFQKVKFVYPKNKESVEIMQSCFDVDNLPTEFGGKATMKYDHEEFSKLMVQDDVKTAKFWGLDQTINGNDAKES